MNAIDDKEGRYIIKIHVFCFVTSSFEKNGKLIEVIETEMERVCPLSILFVYVRLIIHTRLPVHFSLIIITCVYMCLVRLAATINVALMSKLFTFSDLV
jgi:hypothetical protein